MRGQESLSWADGKVKNSVQTICLVADGSVFLRYKQDFYKKKLDTDFDTMGIKIGVQ